MTNHAAAPEIVIITGMSGAGRSTAAKALEDLDWFVADNLPAAMLVTMLDLARRARAEVPRVAAVVDIRSRAFSTDLKSAIAELDGIGAHPYVVFLEASDETLVRRFENVRRPHPLQENGRVIDGINAEREQLQSIRAEADLILDTSGLNIHELRSRVREAFGNESDTAVRVNVLSFGFKYGLPVDADMVADCRFLPNPHWIPELAPQNGQDPAVKNYVLGQPGHRGIPARLPGGTPGHPERLRAQRQALHDAGGGLHRRQAPQRGDRRGTRLPARRAVAGRPGSPPRSRT